ncbi:hypothetical protein HOY80DRAFT_1055754 [Tuber brumale]|nr:hypothetical protein HOY80DRAFT_1055754 [Tuber brumale]
MASSGDHPQGPAITITYRARASPTGSGDYLQGPAVNYRAPQSPAVTGRNLTHTTRPYPSSPCSRKSNPIVIATVGAVSGTTLSQIAKERITDHQLELERRKHNSGSNCHGHPGQGG